jgi:hypothetical protein
MSPARLMKSLGHKPLGRTICNERIAFYRGPQELLRWRTFVLTAVHRYRWALSARES